jgi:hypothetical protein
MLSGIPESGLGFGDGYYSLKSFANALALRMFLSCVDLFPPASKTITTSPRWMK